MLDRYDQDLLLEYLEDELDADRRAEIDAMLSDDPKLAGLLVEMAKDRAALRSLPQADAPPGLIHDATHAMERQMLLDDTLEDTGPIPLSRGRAHAAEHTRSISWGRVVGLTGLAASVAIVAAILVITFEDPLLRTASDLADNTLDGTANQPEQPRDNAETSPPDDGVVNSVTSERLAAESETDQADAGSIASAPPADALAKATEGVREQARLLDRDPRITTPEKTPAAARSALNDPAEASLGNAVSAPRPTAAITAIQPQQQLVLYAESPEVTRQHLVSFCIANGIPVVQPESTAVAQNPELLLGQLNADRPTQGDDINPATDFALLLNESQLETLVAKLNTDISDAAWRAGDTKPTTSQVALLTDVSPFAKKNRSAIADEASLPEADVSRIEKLEDSQQAEPMPQQAIQLRSPDLGSADANRRNSYNLKAQQRGGYPQPVTPLPLARRPADFAAADAAVPDPSASQPGIELAPAESASTEPVAQDESADQVNEARQKPEVDDDESATRQAKKPVAIDATRGNWLSAHLPLGDTTPLLLSWRDREVDKPSKLVPVVIRQAEPNQVDTLRQQQAKQESREKPAATNAEANSAEPSDTRDTSEADDASK